MTQTVFTNYWINQRDQVKKEHGSFLTEEAAIKGIETWWEIHKKHHKNVEYKRTNTHALEIYYGDDNYFYRIEQHPLKEPLPSTKYRLKTAGQIHSERLKYQLREDVLLFDELSEPYRDRIITTMADISKARNFVYTEKGVPIIKLSDVKYLTQV